MTKTNVIIFGFILLLSGCSANWHLKRSARHELIAISKGAEIKPDTFYKLIKVRVQETVKDTLFISRPGDTIRISKDLLKLVYIDLPGDSVWIQGKCDSIVKEVLVPVTVTKVVSAAKSWMSNWVLFLLIGFAVGVILAFFIRR